jgi:hypothetical protein
MERLEPSQRESISKMSSDRLRMKLAKAEFAALSREHLPMAAWAILVVEGTELPSLAAAARAPAVGYDVELERRRFEFEILKYERRKWRPPG